MKQAHFEDFWNDCERLIKSHFSELNFSDHIKMAKHYLDNIPENAILDEQTEIIGNVLFHICGLTLLKNVNSALALKLAMDEKKQELMDPNE